MKSTIGDARILIVDDEAPQRSVLAGYLRKQGHTVVEAGSAGEAMAQLRKSTIEIVFTDVRMPGTSGHELLNQIRVQFPKQPLVS